MTLPPSLARRLVTLVAVPMSAFHLYVAFVGPPSAYVMRGSHLAFALVLAFLVVPGRHGNAGRVGITDLLWVALAAAAALFPSLNLDYIENRMYYVDDPKVADYVFGGTLIVLLIEATRRATGWALPITALAFLAYGLAVAGQSAGIMLDQLYLTTEGIFGIPLYASATYVMLAILFGAFVERSGAGELFMDFALAMAGHISGGPAKVAVITSSLFGTVSGSAVANAMTTGTFTIPLMKRTGYRPAFAGAVEAVASTGGQLMPPIMGAAAFVMAEFLGTSYLAVAGFALLPAVLNCVAVFMAVHFEARRIGPKGLPRADLPRMKAVLSERGHLFLPLMISVAVLLAGRSAAFAALCGIASVIPTTWPRASTRGSFTPPKEDPVPIQLYAFDTPNGRKVSVALEEMALPYEVHVVDITRGEQHASEFVRLSPNHKIPAIVDPDGPGGRPLHLSESGAILIYLAEKTGRFMPRDPVRRLRALEWLMFQMGGFGPMPGQVHHFIALDNETDRAYGLKRYMAETRRLYGVMDAHLAVHEHFADEVSIADFAILGWAWRHPRHHVDLADFPNVKRWYDAMMARPGVQRGFAVPLRRPAS